MLIEKFFAQIVQEFIRFITGKLYTDSQIQSITSGTTGKYLSQFFPTPKDELAAKEKVEAASKHIMAANSIVGELKADLESQSEQLSELLSKVEQKRELASHYETLANTNEEAFNAYRVEMEDALKRELQEQASEGKRIRQFASFFLWVFTLVAGAVLGAYFREIVNWFQTVI